MQERIGRLFWFSVFFTLVIKVLLAVAIPITSDEAYFVLWARHLDFGYYDHPPLVGWLLYLFMEMTGGSSLAVRLLAVHSTIVVGIGIYGILKRFDRFKATLIAVLFLISPINILNILVTTDTPLIIFSFFSVLCLYRALADKSYLYYFLSGVFLGLAFLSKYFAVLLGLSYVVYFVFSKEKREKATGFLLLFAAVVPFVALNVYWNYTHCWANIMFNLFNRNKKETFSLLKFAVFIVSQWYLITPPVFYYLFKRRKTLGGLFGDDRTRVFAFAFTAPLAVLLLLSFKKMVGLHWVLAFYPFMYILVFPVLTEEELMKSIRFMLVFSLAHLFAIGAILSVPLERFQGNKNYPIIVLGTHPGEVILHLRQYEGQFLFATPSYANSAVISYYYNRYFAVFGQGSHHGRQDDLIIDFRNWDGRNVLVLEGSPPDRDKYTPLFGSLDIKEFRVRGAKYYLVLGYDFKYEEYRERILRPIKEKYYNLPAFLPIGACYFRDKYFKDWR